MKRKLIVSLLVGTMFIVGGCTSNNDSNKNEDSKTPDKVMVTDREGNEVEIPENIETIISTAPSNTEVIVGLGQGDKLVAVDTYSTDIEGVDEELTKIDFSNPDAEAIIGLDPDIIIASGHNKSGSAEDPFKPISEAGIPVVYLPSSDSIEGIHEDIEFIADVLNVDEEGDKLIADMNKELEEIKAIGETIEDKKTVYFEIGPAPNLYSFGHSTFLNEMIEIVGAENIFKDEEAWIGPSAESVIDKNPDVILTNVNYIENPIEEIKGRDGFENIDAVKEDDVYQIDTNSSSRPSHNSVVALREMAEAIYPEYYGK